MKTTSIKPRNPKCSNSTQPKTAAARTSTVLTSRNYSSATNIATNEPKNDPQVEKLEFFFFQSHQNCKTRENFAHRLKFWRCQNQKSKGQKNKNPEKMRANWGWRDWSGGKRQTGERQTEKKRVCGRWREQDQILEHSEMGILKMWSEKDKEMNS